jgi:hypothetical protein
LGPGKGGPEEGVRIWGGEDFLKEKSSRPASGAAWGEAEQKPERRDTANNYYICGVLIAN